MIRKSLYCRLLSVLVAGCANPMTSDIRVETRLDPKVNFKGYKTYSWLGTAAIVNDPEGRCEPPSFDADAEITFLINRGLHAYGMVESQVDPDMCVYYGAGIDMQNVEIQADPATDLEQLVNVPRGELTVVLIDGNSELAIRGGQAIADIKQDPDPEVTRKRLACAIEKMFAELPG